MSTEVMRYSGQSYLAIYRATSGLGLVKDAVVVAIFKIMNGERGNVVMLGQGRVT